MTIGVVLFSYNRPRMIRDAIASIIRNRPDEVVLCDDGSDVFPNVPEGWLTVAMPRWWSGLEPKPNNAPRLGNTARRMLQTDYVAWLCDDDIMADGWLDYVRRAPPAPLYIGDVSFFKEKPEDGTLWDARAVHPSRMTTGNWVQRRDLKVEWPEDGMHSHDARYVSDVLRAAGSPAGPGPFLHERLALHYRNHPNTISNQLRDGRYGKGPAE